jgi:transposase
MSKDASPSIDVAALPDDPALLKQLLAEREVIIAAREVIIAEREAIIAEREAIIAQIRQEAAEQLEALQTRLEAEHKAVVLALLRRYYGPRSETFDPRQLLLFGQQVSAMPLDQASIAAEAGQQLVTRQVKSRHLHGRGQLPAALERIEIEHDLEDQACPACGHQRHRIGAETSEQLEYFPASFKVLKHIRHKYACSTCEQAGYPPQIATAKKPPQPIDKGLPGPGLLAYVVTSKLGDHLPLYRLENIFTRQRVEIPRSTMCAWMRAAGELVQPLVALLRARIVQSRVISTDDTTVPIQSPGAKQCRQGRIWCYLGDEANPYIVYDYTPSRTRDGPARWLAGYEGYLQADAYGGYDGLFHSQRVTEVACWAHARRKFYDAQDSDRRRAAEMLAMIGELYALEREAKQADEAARLKLRQDRAVPVLTRIKTWLDAEREIVLPRSPLAGAIGYALNQWQALQAYTTQGYLAIDNNASERALKRVAIGRKNWLFAGHDEAAASHARLWSLIASCERHQIDPQRYLTCVLAKISQTPAAELNQFLPDAWAKADAKEPRLPESTAR